MAFVVFSLLEAGFPAPADTLEFDPVPRFACVRTSLDESCALVTGCFCLRAREDFERPVELDFPDPLAELDALPFVAAPLFEAELFIGAAPFAAADAFPRFVFVPERDALFAPCDVRLFPFRVAVVPLERFFAFCFFAAVAPLADAFSDVESDRLADFFEDAFFFVLLVFLLVFRLATFARPTSKKSS